MAAGRTKRHAAVMLRLRREHLQAVAVLIILGVLVALGTIHALRQNGVAMTHTQVVLDCHYAGNGAHTHNADCYDDDGNLVCPLPEREAHTHDDACYNEAGELVCGLQETLGEHVHGPGCFVAVQVPDDSEDGAEGSASGVGALATSAGSETPSSDAAGDSVDAAASEESSNAAGATDAADDYNVPVDEATAAAMPEQVFEHIITRADADGNETPVLTVHVDAPAGALPKGTTMQAQWVDPAGLSPKAQQAVEDAVAEKTEGKIVSQQAVDITFFDAEGNKVEPARKLTVTFASAMLDTKDKPVVVHVDDLTEDEALQLEQGLAEGKTVEEAEPDRAAQPVDALSDAALAQRELTLADDELAVASDQFSTYVINVTSLRHAMRANGETVTVVADAPAAAGIPADAELKVAEVSEAGGYDSYLNQVSEVVPEGDIRLARFFDIKIVDGQGNELQPAEPVAVRIELADAPTEENTAATVVHFPDEGGMDVVAASESEGTTSFDAEGFSVYGVVYTVGYEVEADADLPAQEFSAKIGNITVMVSAPEGAFPEGTTMELMPVKADDVMDAVTETVEGPVAEVAAVDITFRDVTGVEVQPKIPISVTMTNKTAPQMGTPVVVHVSGDGQANVVEQATQAATNNEVVFDAESFSVYAMVIIETDEGSFTFEGDAYAVTVSYTKEAEIPFGTELEVTEITPDQDQYWDLWSQTIEKLNEGVTWDNHDAPDPRKGLSDAAFFDITLVKDGEKIEPKVPLKVSIRFKEGGVIVPKGENLLVVHFAEDGIELIEDVEVESGKVTDEYLPRSMREGSLAESFSYEQGSFSIVGTGSTSEYIEINEHNISGPALKLAAVNSRESHIKASKTLTDTNGDGVYELALNVEGASQSTGSTVVDKSNVVIVVDVSGSMKESTYSEYTYSPDTYNQDSKYYGVYTDIYGGDHYVRIVRNQNNTGWKWLDYNTSYDGRVYFGQTKLEATQEALNELVDALLANNRTAGTVAEDGTKLDDIVEISLVKFAYANDDNHDAYGNWTNVNGTSTLVRNATAAGSVNENGTLKYAIANLWAGGGTNWERALNQALAEASGYKTAQPDEDTSIIFLTDGVPTSWGTTNVAGSETSDNTHTGWNRASDDARAIVSNGITLYNIFSFGTDTTKYAYDGGRTDADYLRSLTNYAYTGSGTYANTDRNTEYVQNYFFNAKDTTALTDAFRKIIKKITNEVGYGGVEYDDGLTVGVTSASITVDGAAHPETFRYKVSDSDGTEIYSVKINNGVATFTIAGNEGTYTDNSPETVTTVIDPNDHSKDINSTVYSVDVDGVTYQMSPATINTSTGMIEWDLAGLGILENGKTYTVAFDVWPNQWSYDLVADLNNGLKTLDEAKAEVIAARGQEAWDQIENALIMPSDDNGGKYAIRTNYKQEVKYYTVDSTTDEQGHETVAYTPKDPFKPTSPEPISLTSTTMELRKLWKDSLDQTQLNEWLEEGHQKIKLHIWKADTLAELQSDITNYAEADGSGSYAQADEHDYVDKTLGWNDDTGEYDELKTLNDGRRYWEKDLEVAPGVMISLQTAIDMGIDTTAPQHSANIVTYGNKQYYVIEKGHYYAVTEEDVERHFELNTIVYHPMLVDGVLSNVAFNSDGTVKEITPLTSMDATNALKGGINVQKKVFDGEGNELTEIVSTADTFKVKITLKNADGTPYENWDYRIYYGQNNPAGVWNQASGSYGRTDHFYGSADNGGIIEAELYVGDVIRIINVPAGVTYTVTETEYDTSVYAPGTSFTFPLVTGGQTKSFTTDTSGVSYMISSGENDNFAADAGHAVVSNSVCQAVVVNKVPKAKIQILKLGDASDDNPLKNVKFKMYYDKECTKPVTKDAMGVAIPGLDSDGNIVTDNNGYANLGTLAGKYYLKEISTADGYNLLAEPVEIRVVKNGTGDVVVQAGCDQEGIIYDNKPGWISYEESTGVWTVRVSNTSGVELPAAGGSGTAMLYALGTALVAVGAFVLVRGKMRMA